MTVKIKVEAKSQSEKIRVKKITSRKIGHRQTVGHSMFVHQKDFNKLMGLAGLR